MGNILSILFPSKAELPAPASPAKQPASSPAEETAPVEAKEEDSAPQEAIKEEAEEAPAPSEEVIGEVEEVPAPSGEAITPSAEKVEDESPVVDTSPLPKAVEAEEIAEAVETIGSIADDESAKVPLETAAAPIKEDDTVHLVKEILHAPIKENSPEPVKEDSPEPVKKASPEPVKEDSPEPVKEVSPEPVREESTIPIREDSPTFVKEDSPAPIKEDSYVFVKEDSPAPIKEDAPALIKEDSPTPIKEDSDSSVQVLREDSPVSSVPARTESPDPVHVPLSSPASLPVEEEIESLGGISDDSEESPAAPIKEDGPAPIKEDSPAPIREDSPAPTKDDSPAPTKEDSPAPVKEDSPAPIKEDSPAPIKENSPAPIKGDSPALINEDSDSSVPVLREDSPVSSVPARTESPAPVHAPLSPPTSLPVEEEIESLGGISDDSVKENTFAESLTISSVKKSAAEALKEFLEQGPSVKEDSALKAETPNKDSKESSPERDIREESPVKADSPLPVKGRSPSLKDDSESEDEKVSSIVALQSLMTADVTPNVPQNESVTKEGHFVQYELIPDASDEKNANVQDKPDETATKKDYYIDVTPKVPDNEMATKEGYLIHCEEVIPEASNQKNVQDKSNEMVEAIGSIEDTIVEDGIKEDKMGLLSKAEE